MNTNLEQELRRHCPSGYLPRSKARQLLNGIITPGTLANYDSKGQGPPGAIRINGKISYPIQEFCEWLQQRTSQR